MGVFVISKNLNNLPKRIMSATIFIKAYNQKTKREKKRYLSCWAPSAFQDSLNEEFNFNWAWNSIEGEEYFTKKEHLKAFKRMAKSNKDSGGNPYAEVAEYLEKYGTITMWAEY